MTNKKGKKKNIRSASSKQVSQLQRQIGKLERGEKQGRWGFDVGGFSAGPVKLDKLSFSTKKDSIRNVGRSAPTVGVATYETNDIQVQMPRLTELRNSSMGLVYALEGTERIGNITSLSGGGDAQGNIIFSTNISPSSFADTRIYQWADLFEFFQFASLQFVYQPSVGSETNGQLIGFVESDPSDPLPGSEPANVQRAAAHAEQKSTQVWQSQVFETGIFASDNAWKCTDNSSASDVAEVRQAYQGIFYLLAGTDLPEASTPFGVLYIRYILLFKTPQLGTVSVPLPQLPIQYYQTLGSRDTSWTHYISHYCANLVPSSVGYTGLDVDVSGGGNIILISAEIGQYYSYDIITFCDSATFASTWNVTLTVACDSGGNIVDESGLLSAGGPAAAGTTFTLWSSGLIQATGEDIVLQVDFVNSGGVNPTFGSGGLYSLAKFCKVQAALDAKTRERNTPCFRAQRKQPRRLLAEVEAERALVRALRAGQPAPQRLHAQIESGEELHDSDDVAEDKGSSSRKTPECVRPIERYDLRRPALRGLGTPPQGASKTSN
jgi:hypothetical protein